MLDVLSKLAVKLKPLQKLSYVLIAILAAIIIFQLNQPSSLQTDKSNSYAFFSFLTCIWLLLFNLLIAIFDNVPVISSDKQAIFSRIKSKVRRGFYHFLALLFVALTLIIIFLSIRMLRL